VHCVGTECNCDFGMIVGLTLQSCGAMASGDCAEKAVCAESDGSIGEEVSNLEATDAAFEDVPSEDVAAADMTHEDRAGDVVSADVGSEAIAIEEFGSSDVTGNDGPIADVKSEDATSKDATNEDATSPDVVSEDVVTDTGGRKDRNAACVPSSCPGCLPNFVQCCKSDTICGCSLSLLFPPGPCN
jgi:hypothetical protein